MEKILAALVMMPICGATYAAEVKILSAGAVEPGLHAFAKLAKQQTGHDLRIQLNVLAFPAGKAACVSGGVE